MSEKEDVDKKPEIIQEPLDDAALEKLAVEELMREAARGAARAEVVGPSGWVKGSQAKPNKRFLANTLRNTISSNKYHSSSNNHRKSSRKSPKRDRLEPTIKKDRSKRKY